MVGDAALGGGVGLIDVDALNWSAESVSSWAADCVVEDEDAGASSTILFSIKVSSDNVSFVSYVEA